MFLSLVNLLKSLMRPPDTRHSLIVRLKDSRNDLAWTEFVCAYEPFLTRLVRKQGTPDRHVADVTQQLLIAIAKSVDGWKADGKTASFRRWLGCVARNVVIKFMVRERKHVTGEGGSDFLKALTETVDPSIDAELQLQYEQELILWAAERVRSEFRESSWQAFWETEVIGRSIAEVAKELGVSVGSVYMSRSRIFARIRAVIEEVLDED
jgi:RNA polymerase sigma-70 factor (ECF subfamily)